MLFYKFSSGTTNRGKDTGDITLAKEGSKCGEGKVNMFYFLVVSEKLSYVPYYAQFVILL